MKLSFGILVNLPLVFTAFTVQAQERWTLESVFFHNKVSLFRQADDFIPITESDTKALSSHLYFNAPSLLNETKSGHRERYFDLFTGNQSEYTAGARWMKSKHSPDIFLGASRLEAWVSVRPTTFHVISIQKPVSPLDEVGDTIADFYYGASVFRSQIGLGLSYSTQIIGYKRLSIYSGVQLGYHIEYGSANIRESLSDAVLINRPNDSVNVFYQPINSQMQRLNIALAPTHIFIVGLQIGMDYTVHKRIQLFGLIQAQLMAAKNAEAKTTNNARGIALPASIGIRYLLKPGKTRVFG